jgi:hypothetical protein
MKILVNRFYDNGKATLSAVYINGKFQCFGLEDEYRPVNKKVYGETRIPEGVYDVVFRKEGTHHEHYSKKFGSNHHGMLHIINVPNFEYILIHIGNTERDTAGCLLVGSVASSDGTISYSTAAYQSFYKVVAQALLKNEKVTINFADIQPK